MYTNLFPSCLCDREVIFDEADGIGMTPTEDLLGQEPDLLHIGLVSLKLLAEFLNIQNSQYSHLMIHMDLPY